MLHMGERRLALRSQRGPLLYVLASLCYGCVLGCGSGTPPAEPEAKVRLTKLLRLYQAYMETHKKGPPNEDALREFGEKLSLKGLEESLIGYDLDSIFISPRDRQKYVIQYHLNFDAGGPPRAVAWEMNGQGGKRFVALSTGYVEEYDDATFQECCK